MFAFNPLLSPQFPRIRLANQLFILCALLVVAAILLIPSDAWALGAGGGLPYEGWLAKLRNSVSGPVAFSISLIAIIVTGATLIFGGDLNGFFRSLVFLVLVMALIVSANKMLSGLFGGSAEIAALKLWFAPATV